MATAPEPARRVSPALIVALVVIAVAALGFFVVRPLLFPPVEEPAPAPPPRAAQPTPEPSPSPSPAPPAETFEVFESKDPFRPLVVAGAPGPATVAATPGAAPTEPGVAGAPAPAGGQRVSVLDIFEQSGVTLVQVKVGTTVYTVSTGQTFATTFKLLSVSGRCATFLNGDDKFTLCVGEEIVK